MPWADYLDPKFMSVPILSARQHAHDEIFDEVVCFETMIAPGSVGSLFATCPFCDLTWKAGEFEGEVPGVMHDEPACETFLELSPIVFMAKARIAGARTLS